MNIFTPEDLLEYHYKETSPDMTLAISSALENDWALQQKYLVICQAAERLDRSMLSPRAGSVDAIMAHAASHISTEAH